LQYQQKSVGTGILDASLDKVVPTTWAACL